MCLLSVFLLCHILRLPICTFPKPERKELPNVQRNISHGKIMLYFNSVSEIAISETVTTKDNVSFNFSDYILADRTRRQYYER